MLTTRAAGTVLALLMSRNAWAQTAPQLETPPATPVKLELSGTPAGVRFYVTPMVTVGARAPHAGRTGTCLPPCEAELLPGTYRVALSVPGSRAVAPDQPITISGPATVQGKYVSYGWMRATGWVVLVGGTITGFAVAAGAFDGSHSNEQNHELGAEGFADVWRAMLATPILLASVGIGLPMLLKRDEVKITVSPLTTAATPLGRSDSAPSSASALLPRGVGLFGAF
jgi:hypothetical protein